MHQLHCTHLPLLHSFTFSLFSLLVLIITVYRLHYTKAELELLEVTLEDMKTSLIFTHWEAADAMSAAALPRLHFSNAAAGHYG